LSAGLAVGFGGTVLRPVTETSTTTKPVTTIQSRTSTRTSDFFRFHRYPPVEKIYSVFLFIAGLSLRERKDRKKKFYNNVNSKKLKCLEELVTANCGDAQLHQGWRRGGITNLTVPVRRPKRLK
jgi:hypothetical protein